jgi:hypothetical protein
MNKERLNINNPRLPRNKRGFAKSVLSAMRERREISGEPMRPQSEPASEPNPDMVQTAAEVHEMPLREGALPHEPITQPEREKAPHTPLGKRAVGAVLRQGTA